MGFGSALNEKGDAKPLSYQTSVVDLLKNLRNSVLNKNNSTVFCLRKVFDTILFQYGAVSASRLIDDNKVVDNFQDEVKHRFAKITFFLRQQNQAHHAMAIETLFDHILSNGPSLNHQLDVNALLLMLLCLSGGNDSCTYRGVNLEKNTRNLLKNANPRFLASNDTTNKIETIMGRKHKLLERNANVDDLSYAILSGPPESIKHYDVNELLSDLPGHNKLSNFWRDDLKNDSSKVYLFGAIRENQLHPKEKRYQSLNFALNLPSISDPVDPMDSFRAKEKPLQYANKTIPKNLSFYSKSIAKVLELSVFDCKKKDEKEDFFFSRETSIRSNEVLGAEMSCGSNVKSNPHNDQANASYKKCWEQLDTTKKMQDRIEGCSIYGIVSKQNEYDIYISEERAIKAISNAFLGLGSEFFRVDESTCTFYPTRCHFATHLRNEEIVTIPSFLLQDIATIGSMFLRLSCFSRYFSATVSHGGQILQSLGLSISTYLSTQEAYVMKVQSNTPTILEFLNDIKMLHSRIMFLGTLLFCDNDTDWNVSMERDKNDFPCDLKNRIPKGTKMLSHIYQCTRSYTLVECDVGLCKLCTWILNKACEPYFRIISHWIYSGVMSTLNDPFNEVVTYEENQMIGQEKPYKWNPSTLIWHHPCFISKQISHQLEYCGYFVNLILDTNSAIYARISGNFKIKLSIEFDKALRLEKQFHLDMHHIDKYNELVRYTQEIIEKRKQKDKQHKERIQERVKELHSMITEHKKLKQEKRNVDMRKKQESMKFILDDIANKKNEKTNAYEKENQIITRLLVQEEEEAKKERILIEQAKTFLLEKYGSKMAKMDVKQRSLVWKFQHIQQMNQSKRKLKELYEKEQIKWEKEKESHNFIIMKNHNINNLIKDDNESGNSVYYDEANNNDQEGASEMDQSNDDIDINVEDNISIIDEEEDNIFDMINPEDNDCIQIISINSKEKKDVVLGELQKVSVPITLPLEDSKENVEKKNDNSVQNKDKSDEQISLIIKHSTGESSNIIESFNMDKDEIKMMNNRLYTQDNFNVLNDYYNQMIQNFQPFLCFEKISSDGIWEPLDEIISSSIVRPVYQQCKLVDFASLQLFINSINILHHIEALRKVYFMKEGYCYNVFIQQLLNGLLLNESKIDWTNSTNVQNAMENAMQICGIDDDEYFTSIQFHNDALTSTKMNSFWNGIQMDYPIQYPLSYVLNNETMEIYKRVHQFMFNHRFLSIQIHQSISKFKCLRKQTTSHHVIGFEFYPLLWHELSQFMSSFEQYLSSQILEFGWIEFNQDLKNVRSILQLRDIHLKYVRRAETRCFLDKKSIITSKHLQKCLQTIDDLNALVNRIDFTASDSMNTWIEKAQVSRNLFKQSVQNLCSCLVDNLRNGNSSDCAYYQDLLLRINYTQYYYQEEMLL